MSQVSSLVLGSGPVRDRVGMIAAGVALVGLFTRFSQATTTDERVNIAFEGVKVVTDLTPSQSDDELAAKVGKYLDTPQAVALLDAAVEFYKFVRSA